MNEVSMAQITAMALDYLRLSIDANVDLSIAHSPINYFHVLSFNNTSLA